ncbi:uncharacterized protein TM35_000015440 [Trypanosoma theileri]|uniref:Uncharacterized protein n=1 Tax=Trypanosoma theileri TaxID=67003 RepID=A0A1X0P9Q5_9TRYP|nr:uncharacterized protein TM35_000015440 [Trypanosoma theileri]ORC93667.1 hypothetical protein TM35_000015440 [Trypanosoma theileri]
MAEGSLVSSATQLVATVRHENMQLKRCLAEVRHENQVLKKQLYHLSALLDIAVSKLASKGITLETPIGIRELRAAVSQREIVNLSNDVIDAGDLAYEKATTESSSNRQFQHRRDLREHTKPIQCAAFSQGDQPILATGGLDCRVILHNFMTGEKVLDIKGHEQNVADVAWFESSGNVLSASFDGTVKVWDPRHSSGSSSNNGNNNCGTTSPVYQFSATGFVLAAVPLDKAFVFACTDSKKRTSIVDLRVQKPISWKHDIRANTLTFNAAKAQLITGHNNGTIAVWDVRKVGLALSSNSSMDGESAGGNTLMGSFTSAAAEETSGVPISRVSVIENEPSQSAITYIGYHHNSDDTRRLVVVSTDNMVRLYRDIGINTTTGDAFSLRNLVSGVPTRGYTTRAVFWRGVKEKSRVSAFFDDGERETDAQPRRVAECDLLVTAGVENTACVYNVTEAGGAGLVERLEGHRDRVVGAAVHHADSRPIIATYSADCTVKVWTPVKK